MDSYKIIQVQTGQPGEPLSLCRIYAYDSITSTNAKALEMAALGEPEGIVVTADEQTAGRGRRGRGWFSPPGEDIYLSILLRPQVEAEKASRLTLVAAAAVRDAIIKTVCGTDSAQNIQQTAPESRYRIKWPNDIVADGKKLCGILTETRMEGMSIEAVVIGIGINVNNSAFPEEIRGIATSLSCEEGRRFDRMQLIKKLLESFAEKYALFLQTGDLSGLCDTYNSSMAGTHRQAVLSGPGWEKTGTILGIDETGALLLQLQDGSTEHVISGEVSLRGIEGYI